MGKRILGEKSSIEAALATRYISAVLEEFDAKNLRIVIKSDIPPSSGLGSSAAVVVSAVAALNWHMDLDMSQKDISTKSFKIEKQVQMGLGSPMDTAVATFGGYQLVSRAAEPISLPSFDLVVGCTDMPHDTRVEVDKVQRLREMYPDVVEPIFDAIGSISRRALCSIRDLELAELGRLMNINHGLLESIGVGTREINELVYAARGAGCALGAKLTGAGGGGCIIAVPSENNISKIVTAISQARGRAFPVRTGSAGVRLE